MASTLTDNGWVVEPDVVDERKDLPRLSGAQITAINARIAAGSKEFPVGTRVIRTDDGLVMSVQGVGTAAVFASVDVNLAGAVKTVDLGAAAGAELVGTAEGSLTDALDARVKAIDLAAPTGAEDVGGSYANSSTAISLPATTLQFFLRSAPIDIRVVLPGNFVTDASVNYSVQFQKLLNYLRDFGGGRILMPAKFSILAGNLVAYSGVEIVAPEWTSEIVAPTGGYGISVNPGSGGTTNPEDNQRNIRFAGFRLRGQAATPTFSEHAHLLNLNAISSALFEDLDLVAFQGDAAYLGSSNVGGVERHNERITFRRIRADGVNRANRNALSIIDGTDIVVDGFTAYRTTRADMPGAIDIEPDANVYARVRNVTMENLYIEDCRGGVLVQVLTNLTNPLSRVSVRDFKMLNVDAPLTVFSSYDVAQINKSDPAQNVAFEQGSAKGGVTPISLTGQRGFKMRDVSFENFTGSALIGSGTFDRVLSVGVSIRDTEWLRCGSTSGSAVKVDGITEFDYVGNRHIDCGDNTVTGSGVELAPSFPAAVQVSAFRLNEFDKSALTNMQAVKKTGGGSVAFDLLDVSCNKLNGQASVFLDDRDTAYTPSIIGSTGAGTATYTVRLGRYVRRGKTVSVSINLTWSGHTGTGGINVSLPIAAAAGIPNVPCALVMSSIAWTAGATVRALVLAGTATIQLLQEAPSTAGAIVPMSASGTVNVSVEYPIA